LFPLLSEIKMKLFIKLLIISIIIILFFCWDKINFTKRVVEKDNLELLTSKGEKNLLTYEKLPEKSKSKITKKRERFF
jgi:hypothetical protein